MMRHAARDRAHRLGARCLARLLADRERARRDEHGDIPGWVMITVMTITVASAIGVMFTGAVTSFLQSALAQFK
jgi:hypothetical protein